MILDRFLFIFIGAGCLLGFTLFGLRVGFIDENLLSRIGICETRLVNKTPVEPSPTLSEEEEKRLLALTEVYTHDLVTYRKTIYDHIDDFLSVYSKLDCKKNRGACIDMIHSELFDITGYNDIDNRVYNIFDRRDKFAGEYGMYATGVTTEYYEVMGRALNPLVVQMQAIKDFNTAFNTYTTDLPTILRGLQKQIKYALAVRIAPLTLPRDYEFEYRRE